VVAKDERVGVEGEGKNGGERKGGEVGSGGEEVWVGL